jgi:N6-adenosine-specific RNA methylase IME4
MVHFSGKLSVAEKTAEAQDVDLQLCYPAERARPIDPVAVQMLASSISACGLITPITARKTQRSHAGTMCDAFEVITGMHRVEAFRQLGRPTIPAYVLEVDDLHAELMLIDENLCRHDLSPAERARAVTRRKAIYERLHPVTVHVANKGEDGRFQTSRQLGNTAKRFTRATAKATGSPERTVQRDATRGEKLGDHVLNKVVGTSLDKGEELDALVQLSPRTREILVERAASGQTVTAKAAVKREKRDEREAELAKKIAAESLALLVEQFGVIVADPQWGRTVYSEETGMDRHAGNHYPVAKGDQSTQDDAIKALPVASIAAKDCVLGLWCTEPWRGEAVMQAWGFAPVAYFIWVKDIVVSDPGDNGMLRSGQHLEVIGAAGLGYWNRDRCEIMLIGTRGKPICPAPGTQGERVWFARRGEHAAVREDIHSDKPDCALEWFERHWPNTPKIELNARRVRPGWSAWGPCQRQSEIRRKPAV